MCVVSMVGDHFTDKWTTYPGIGGAGIFGPAGTFVSPAGPSSQEFEALKKEVLEMKDLLRRAKIYDEKNNEPNCEMEEKIAILRKIAELVGVDLNDIFKPKTSK